VIVNPTDVRQQVPLGRSYRLLAGDQDPATNSGLLTSELSLGRYSGVILLKS
jgi:hypothetical protein